MPEQKSFNNPADFEAIKGVLKSLQEKRKVNEGNVMDDVEFNNDNNEDLMLGEVNIPMVEELRKDIDTSFSSFKQGGEYKTGTLATLFVALYRELEDMLPALQPNIDTKLDYMRRVKNLAVDEISIVTLVEETGKRFDELMAMIEEVNEKLSSRSDFVFKDRANSMIMDLKTQKEKGMRELLEKDKLAVKPEAEKAA